MSKSVFKMNLTEFSQLSTGVDPCAGINLLETFNNLGLNTGNVSKLTIDSWFDTECEATKEMLQWLCTALNKNNVLTAQENEEEYEQTLENSSLLIGKQYETALSQLQNEFPGILDYEKNLLDMDCCEDELEMLSDKEHHLEQLLNLNGNLHKKLSKEINKVSEEEIASVVQKENAQKKCIELSYKLDDAHEKLQQQISHYAEHLNEFEHGSRPTFISNVPTAKYDQYYIDIVSYLTFLVKQEYDFLPNLEVTVRTAKKQLLQDSTSNIDFAVDELEVLRQRITKSVQNYLQSQVTKEKLQAQLEFLQDLNVNDVLGISVFDDSINFALEARVLSKEGLLEELCLGIENITRQISNSFVDGPKINLIENTMMDNQKKLDNLALLDAIIKEILAKHILLHCMLEKEKNDVQSTDKFFRNVQRHIVHKLQYSQSQIEAMNEVINRHSIYKTLPVEQKLKLLTIIKTLLVNNDSKTSVDISTLDAMKNFNNECNTIEQQVFFNDYTYHRTYSQQIEQEIEIMQKFLVNGPTIQITIFPYQLQSSFNEVNSLLETQATALKTTMQILNNAEKKLSESKWFQMRRQLWMWFLFEPKRVLHAIDQIETAIKQKRNENA